MDLKHLITRGLVGYQPIFFPNGVISGTGLQFFGNLRAMRQEAADGGFYKVDEDTPRQLDDGKNTFNRGRLGNLYVPPEFGAHAEFDSEYYFCVEDESKEIFAKYNLILLEIYRHFAFKSLEVARGLGCEIDTMMEVGANTCVFPLAFAEAGVAECHGSDIVDYSTVVDLLSALKGSSLTFHHMQDDSEATWRSLPKTDLVWSYAVVLHQSNALAHLTRLASLAKKAMFVMTLTEPGEWRSDQEMGIRYLSANSYYQADFPNCFDVTIVSPELLRYSLKRLGFLQVVEIPHPAIASLDNREKGDFDYWMSRHSFFLAVRDEALNEDQLNDYSISTERSPFKGDNVLVHTGFHHNIVLGRSKYFIVPQGHPFDMHDNHYAAFSTLTGGMEHFRNLPDEKTPYPIPVATLETGELVRFANRMYFKPSGSEVKFVYPGEIDLPVLENIEAWNAVIAAIGEAGIGAAPGVIVGFADGVLVLKTGPDTFEARAVLPGGGLGKPKPSASSAEEVLKAVAVDSLLESMTIADRSAATTAMVESENGWRKSLDIPLTAPPSR